LCPSRYSESLWGVDVAEKMSCTSTIQFTRGSATRDPSLLSAPLSSHGGGGGGGGGAEHREYWGTPKQCICTCDSATLVATVFLNKVVIPIHLCKLQHSRVRCVADTMPRGCVCTAVCVLLVTVSHFGAWTWPRRCRVRVRFNSLEGQQLGTLHFSARYFLQVEAVKRKTGSDAEGTKAFAFSKHPDVDILLLSLDDERTTHKAFDIQDRDLSIELLEAWLTSDASEISDVIEHVSGGVHQRAQLRLALYRIDRTLSNRLKVNPVAPVV
jgi:hypothetical protein